MAIFCTMPSRTWIYTMQATVLPQKNSQIQQLTTAGTLQICLQKAKLSAARCWQRWTVNQDCSLKLVCVNGSTFVNIKPTDFHTTCFMQDAQPTSTKATAMGSTATITSAKDAVVNCWIWLFF